MRLVIAFVLLLAGAVLLPAATTFNITPSPISVNPGQNFTIYLTATTDGMYAFQGDFSFTPGLVQVNDIIGLGDYAGLYLFDPIDNVGGVVTNILASLIGPGLTVGTDVQLLEIDGTALAAGDVTFTFTPSMVVTNPDTFDVDPNVTANPGLATVVTPEPSTLALVAVAGLLAIGRRRRLSDQRERCPEVRIGPA